MYLNPNSSGFKIAPSSIRCDVCGNGAIISFRGGNVCYRDYMELHQKDADRYCAEHHLDTTEKKIDHCRKLLGLFIQRQKKISREPGEEG